MAATCEMCVCAYAHVCSELPKKLEKRLESSYFAHLWSFRRLSAAAALICGYETLPLIGRGHRTRDDMQMEWSDKRWKMFYE